MALKEILEKKQAKIVLGGLLAVVSLLSLWLGLNRKSNRVAQGKENTFAHTETEITKEEEIDGLKFSNISLITDNGYTTFTSDVTNISDNEINIMNVDIVLKDKNGETVITLLGNIGDKMKPNESRIITASAKGEFKNVKSKTIVKQNQE